MRYFKIVLPVFIFIFISSSTNAQNYSDTVSAEQYYALGDKYYKLQKLDSSNIFYQKAADIYKQTAVKNNDTLKWLEYVKLRYYIAWNLSSLSDFDNSVDVLKDALKKSLKHLTKNHIVNAKLYNGLGRAYYRKSEFDAAIKYYTESLNIIKGLFGEEHIKLATPYNNLANVFFSKNEFELSLLFYFKSIQIKKKVFGEESTKVAASYNNVGAVYRKMGEYDLSLEYFLKSSQINKKKNGEKNIDVAVSYHNIANVYSLKKDYDKALKYYLKSLEIGKELFGEKNSHITANYLGIGNVYLQKKEFDSALKFQLKALAVRRELLGENNTFTAGSYNSIGNIYVKKGEYKLSLANYYKALNIRLKRFGEKHSETAETYNDIAQVYTQKNEYGTALKYYQKGIVSSIKNFNDTLNIYSCPVIKDCLNWTELLNSLQAKAMIFADTSIKLPITNLNKLELALKYYQACDTLISQVSKNMKTKSDKLALGGSASDIYMNAVNVALDLSKEDISLKSPQQMRAYAFYFSEKNKSSVLLDALAGSEALKFAGIPDALLKKEHDLQNQIAFYKKESLEDVDSTKEIRINDKLFKANRTYDSLIIVFEREYPEYFDLKYNQNPASVKEISKIINRKTTIISYQIGDSLITIFAIKQNKFFINQVHKPKDLDLKINNLRVYISNLKFLRSDIDSYKHITVDEYQKVAFDFYSLLFPNQLKAFIGKRTKNIIIIPDGKLAVIPFEALLTKKYTAEWTDWNNKAYFSEMPFLIKDFNISYSYSANLFYKTFSKKKQKNVEITEINDWIAFAPVFDDENISGTNLRTRNILNEAATDNFGTANTRAFLDGGGYVSELPGSEVETKEIFELFEQNNKKAVLKTHKFANEEFIKSGELEKYKYIHFATHGMVNSDKPELSCILLSQDSTSKEDNILYNGEIYNLKLNADLTVLSACETGLGKITKGEGIIGLTRALLYAGSKNIIVSLWQVSDESTQELMVEFYKNMLKPSGFSKNQKYFAGDLQKAKLRLIKEGKYAHPFFWSPFILIGQ
ncbi:MAG: CHAT domain-containing protein [Bacteroidales bacterium]|nr:CHAT domain-containing protein [Bacteroidales bacterium]